MDDKPKKDFPEQKGKERLSAGANGERPKTKRKSDDGKANPLATLDVNSLLSASSLKTQTSPHSIQKDKSLQASTPIAQNVPEACKDSTILRKSENSPQTIYQPSIKSESSPQTKYQPSIESDSSLLTLYQPSIKSEWIKATEKYNEDKYPDKEIASMLKQMKPIISSVPSENSDSIFFIPIKVFYLAERSRLREMIELAETIQEQNEESKLYLTETEGDYKTYPKDWTYLIEMVAQINDNINCFKIRTKKVVNCTKDNVYTKRYFYKYLYFMLLVLVDEHEVQDSFDTVDIYKMCPIISYNDRLFLLQILASRATYESLLFMIKEECDNFFQFMEERETF